MSPPVLLLVDWVLTAVLMLGLWAWQRQTGEADGVDLGWTVGLGVAAVLYAIGLDGGLPARRTLVAGLAVLWSARLALHLWPRVRAPGEDGRYRRLRRAWGADADRRFLRFYQLQAISVPLLAGQYMISMLHPAPGLRIWDALGAFVVVASVAGEGIADHQLAAWRRDPGNDRKTCRRGLWRYSRHPNYFFEWLHWLGYSLIAVGWAWWPATLVVPAIMYMLIRHITGIPPTEAQALESRGEDYRKYQRTTNAFFPGPPRSGMASP